MTVPCLNVYLVEVYPEGFERIKGADLLAGFNSWLVGRGAEPMSATRLGLAAKAVAGLEVVRSNGVRFYRFRNNEVPVVDANKLANVEDVPAAPPQPAPEVATKRRDLPAPASDHVRKPDKVEAPPQPALELVWCVRTGSLHRVLQRYGPEVTVHPPLPGYPAGEGFSVVPSDWLAEPTAEQLAQGVKAHQPPAEEPVVVSEPVVPAPVRAKRVELTPVAVEKAKTPPQGSKGWGDVSVRVNGQPWLLRASRLHNGQEWALLVSADGKKAAACLFEGVELVDVVTPPSIDAAAQELASSFDGVVSAMVEQELELPPGTLLS